MAREGLSLAEQDELARRKSAEEGAKDARQKELDRRASIKKAQEQAAEGALPPLVRAA